MLGAGRGAGDTVVSRDGLSLLGEADLIQVDSSMCKITTVLSAIERKTYRIYDRACDPV